MHIPEHLCSRELGTTCAIEQLVLYMFMQQSAAFKILRTRLKTVPFSENLKRTSSVNPYSQILQVTEDGSQNQDAQNCSAINFPSLLQQFENMQQQHRLHLKNQLHSGKSASTVVLSQVIFAFCSLI
jgi:vacuole morphology and inheritance protein 14